MAYNCAIHSSHHHHNGRAFNDSRNVLMIAIVITGTIMVSEVVGGVLSNSLALLSDAGHMFTDLLALLLSFFALSYAAKPPTSSKTYGFYRMEIVAAFINGVILILISFYIFWEAYQRLIEPASIKGRIMLYVAIVGLVANLIAAIVMHRASHESLNIRGAFLHVLGDALSSFGVIVGALIIEWTNWTFIDPAISCAISLVILWGAYHLIKDAVNILLEATPEEVNTQELTQSLINFKEVQEVHCLHIWAITSGVYALSAHLRVSDMTISSSSTLLEKIRNALRDNFQISHTTIQLESQPSYCEDEMYCQQGQNCMNVFGKKD